MKRRGVIALISTAVVLLLGAVYYFGFTLSGENRWYDLFGGSDLHLSSQGKELYWFDVHHSNDPNASIFGRIENTFKEFRPDLVLVEGGYNHFEGDRDKAIYEGESAFAAWLAKQNGTAVEDIEPPFGEQIAYLQSKYPAEDILAMYLIRQLTSLRFMSDVSRSDFEEMLLDQSRFLVGSGLRVAGEDSLEHILRIVNRFLPQPVGADNWEQLDKRQMAAVYAREGGVLYPIYNDIYLFRNIWLVDLIGRMRGHYDRIFVVMGGQHLEDTRARLKELYP